MCKNCRNFWFCFCNSFECLHQTHTHPPYDDNFNLFTKPAKKRTHPHKSVNYAEKIHKLSVTRFFVSSFSRVCVFFTYMLRIEFWCRLSFFSCYLPFFFSFNFFRLRFMLTFCSICYSFIHAMTTVGNSNIYDVLFMTWEKNSRLYSL